MYMLVLVIAVQGRSLSAGKDVELINQLFGAELCFSAWGKPSC